MCENIFTIAYFLSCVVNFSCLREYCSGEVVILLCAAACLITIGNAQDLYNNNPMIAVNLIFGLVTACLSTYQIGISLLLLWQTRKPVGNIFICSLWYVSHISLLTIYLLLFSAKAAVGCIRRHYTTALITIFIGIVYQAIFIYFSIIVNSYLHSLHLDRYL